MSLAHKSFWNSFRECYGYDNQTRKIHWICVPLFSESDTEIEETLNSLFQTAEEEEEENIIHVMVCVDGKGKANEGPISYLERTLGSRPSTKNQIRVSYEFWHGRIGKGRISAIVKEKNVGLRLNRCFMMEVVLYEGKGEGKQGSIMMVDGDTRIAKKCWKELSLCLAKHPEALIGAKLEPKCRKKQGLYYHQWNEYALKSAIDAQIWNHFECVPWIMGGCWMATMKSCEEVLPDYEASDARSILHWCQNEFGEDRFLTRLFLQKGKPTLVASQAFAATSIPEQLDSWMKQKKRWYQGMLLNTENLNWKLENKDAERLFIVRGVNWLHGCHYSYGIMGCFVHWLMIFGASGFSIASFLLLSASFYVYFLKNPPNTNILTLAVLIHLYGFLTSTFLIQFLTLLPVFGYSLVFSAKQPLSLLLALPSHFLLYVDHLVIPLYSLANLHDLSWGTKSVRKELRSSSTEEVLFFKWKVASKHFVAGLLLYSFSGMGQSLAALSLAYNMLWSLLVSISITSRIMERIF